jgi:PD-(D/E)XK endonuclease
MRKPRGALRGRIPASEESPVRKAARRRGFAARWHGDLGEVAFMHKAMEIGLVVAQPYGTNHPFDFIVQGGRNLWRIQVKSVVHMSDGLYSLCVRRSEGRRLLAYSKSEVDFIAVYIIPEDVWYILPVREVEKRLTLRFRPKGYHRPDIYAHYREASHLLCEPDGLVFG